MLIIHIENELVIAAITWVNLKNIVLSERRQWQGHCTIPLYPVFRQGKFTKK